MRHFLKENIEIIVHQTAKEGKSFCGDSYFYSATDDYFICVVADGLGSGEHAYNASSAVIAVVEEYQHLNVDEIMKLCNQELVNKRGAAVAIFKVEFAKKEFVYSCVGNIRFFLYSSSGKLTYPLPVTGYLSGRPQKFHTQRFSYEKESKFIIYSDGFNIPGAKSILKNHYSLESIAAEIERKYSTSTDDATFIVGSLN